MKILEKATTPDGIDIQIEDWSDTYSFMNILKKSAKNSPNL